MERTIDEYLFRLSSATIGAILRGSETDETEAKNEDPDSAQDEQAANPATKENDPASMTGQSSVSSSGSSDPDISFRLTA